MNGIHDMGGMHGMGPIQYEKNEPPYHATWEARVHAMSSAVGATGKLRLAFVLRSRTSPQPSICA